MPSAHAGIIKPWCDLAEIYDGPLQFPVSFSGCQDRARCAAGTPRAVLVIVDFKVSWLCDGEPIRNKQALFQG